MAKYLVNSTFPANISTTLDRSKYFYSSAAESFNIKKLYSRLLSMKKNQFYVQELQSGVFEPPFRVTLGVTYALHLYVVGNCVIDFPVSGE